MRRFGRSIEATSPSLGAVRLFEPGMVSFEAVMKIMDDERELSDIDFLSIVLHDNVFTTGDDPKPFFESPAEAKNMPAPEAQALWEQIQSIVEPGAPEEGKGQSGTNGSSAS